MYSTTFTPFHVLKNMFVVHSSQGEREREREREGERERESLIHSSITEEQEMGEERENKRIVEMLHLKCINMHALPQPLKKRIF